MSLMNLKAVLYRYAPLESLWRMRKTVAMGALAMAAVSPAVHAQCPEAWVPGIGTVGANAP